MPTSDFDTIRRALSVFNGFDGPKNDELWWRTDREYAPITLLVNCNDFFWWGCSDCEEVTSENIEALEKAAADWLETLGEAERRIVNDCHLLWVARVRGMRPQGAYYKHLPVETHHLFNECGPPRDSGLGNPIAA